MTADLREGSRTAFRAFRPGKAAGALFRIGDYGHRGVIGRTSHCGGDEPQPEHGG